MKNDEPKNNVRIDIKPIEKQVELTPEKLAAIETEFLFLVEGPEELVRKDREREQKRLKEVIELQSGQVRTIKSYLTKDPQPYFPKFPNDVPFYSELYRVIDLGDEWNPNDFYKPPIIATMTNELIYSRFGKTMVSTLRHQAIASGIRLNKFFQYLDIDGQKKVIEYRDDSIKMLKEFKRGELYEFRYAYATEYHTSFQLKFTIT